VAHQEGDINIARIPVSGIGGLGMVAAAMVVAIALPALRWLAVASLVGGIALGLTLIGARNRQARYAAQVGGLILILAVAVGIWIYLRWSA
jgi:hypothetical protein